jgi:hypothetical protein
MPGADAIFDRVEHGFTAPEGAETLDAATRYLEASGHDSCVVYARP